MKFFFALKCTSDVHRPGPVDCLVFHCFAFTVLFSSLESCKLMNTPHDKHRGGRGPCLTCLSMSVFFSLGYILRRYLANYWSSVINKYWRGSCSYSLLLFTPPPPKKKRYLKKTNISKLANKWRFLFKKMFRFRDRLCDDAFILFNSLRRPSQISALLSPINLRTWRYLVMA